MSLWVATCCAECVPSNLAIVESLWPRSLQSVFWLVSPPATRNTFWWEECISVASPLAALWSSPWGGSSIFISLFFSSEVSIHRLESLAFSHTKNGPDQASLVRLEIVSFVLVSCCCCVVLLHCPVVTVFLICLVVLLPCCGGYMLSVPLKEQIGLETRSQQIMTVDLSPWVPTTPFLLDCICLSIP